MRDHRQAMRTLSQAHRALPINLPAGNPLPAATDTAPPAPSEAPARPRGDPFHTHPAYQPIRIAQAAGAAMGLETPFFRTPDAVDGVHQRFGNRTVVNFASYDYLGLNRSPAVGRAVAAAVADWGVSATGSRLAGGARPYHALLESEIADFLGTEAALTFVSGHATNVGAIRALVGPGDLVLVDALAHNSLFEGVRASGADHLTFPHNDWAWVDAQLSARRDRHRHVLIAIEGLYSMDGDMPDLPRFAEVKDRHRAWLMVDEAHSLGVLGATGRGICEEQGLPPDAVEVHMGTLSKTLCSCGGYIAGSRSLVDLLRHTAPGFVYSVAMSAPNAAAARAALAALAADPAPVARLRALSRLFLDRARAAGLDTGNAQGFAVMPVMTGDSLKAVWAAQTLLGRGINSIPVIAPGVPDRAARLRFFLTAAHSEDDVAAAVAATAETLAAYRGLSPAPGPAGSLP